MKAIVIQPLQVDFSDPFWLDLLFYGRGAVNGDGSWGIVVVVFVAYVIWLIASLIMFLNYRYKEAY